MSPGRPRKSGIRSTVRLDRDNYEALAGDGTDERNAIINQAVREYLKDNPVIDGGYQRAEALRLKLQGLTYDEVGRRMGVSRQRIQFLLRPPESVYKQVVGRANEHCEDCGSAVVSGHIHHIDEMRSDFNHPDNLAYLCASCHRKRHSSETN